MVRCIVTASLLAVLLAPAASAQDADPSHAPIPKGGALVQQGQGTPIAEQIDTGNLPGVDFEGPDVSRPTRGPGGLENGVGAIGMALPSTSSSNPVPIEPSDDNGLVGVPLSGNGR